MSTPTTTSKPDVVVKDEQEPDEIELCCDRCGAFILAIEKPTHRLEHIVVFRARLNCKSCNRRHRRRITFDPTTPT